MSLVNCTPHMLNIHQVDGTLNVGPSGTLVRRASTLIDHSVVEGIQIRVTVWGPVTGVPTDLKAGDLLVVSAMAADAISLDTLPKGVSLVSPGRLLRDSAGKPIGCDGLTLWGEGTQP